MRSHQEQVPRKQGLKLSELDDPYLAAFHQEQVPRKQGLKQAYTKNGSIDAPEHQEQVPRKQGLKPVSGLVSLLNFWASRASSTKTRIETSCPLRSSPPYLPIKSKFHENKDWNGSVLLCLIVVAEHQEQVPRKQGLKLIAVLGDDNDVGHQEQVPRKQGLKLIQWPWNFWAVDTSRASSTKTRIETERAAWCSHQLIAHQEQVPRKQGLKLLQDHAKHQHRRHQEQVPRKQGLKHHSPPPYPPFGETSRASSTKTRIETFFGQYQSTRLRSIKSKFHENKDWNGRSISTSSKPDAHQEQVPRKQGLKPNKAGEWRPGSIHQEQVPRKQGLKHWHPAKGTTPPSGHQEQVPRKQGLKQQSISILLRAKSFIKSKFHENKDWNSEHHAWSVASKLPIKSKFHENKDWNEDTDWSSLARELASRASSTKTRIETMSWFSSPPRSFPIKSKFHENKDWNPGLPSASGVNIVHQEQVPRKQGLKHHNNRETHWCPLASRASSTKTRIETSA